MSEFTYEKFNTKLIKVLKDGNFAGWLEATARTTTGLHKERVVTWSGKIDGREINAFTVTGAKIQIEAHVFQCLYQIGKTDGRA